MIFKFKSLTQSRMFREVVLDIINGSIWEAGVAEETAKLAISQ